MRQASWEDIEIGQKILLGVVTLSREEIVDFAGEFDPQPFHLDENAARSTMLGGQAASGWHTCVVVHQLIEAAMCARGVVLRVVGVEDIRFRRPIRPGDSLSGRIVISSKVACHGADVPGAVGAVVEVINQSAEVVATWHLDGVLARRSANAGESGGGCAASKPRPARAARKRGEYAIKFFDEVGVGDDIDLGSYAFTNANIASFRERFAPTDRDWLGESGKPRRVHHWHLVSAWMHCIVRYYRFHSDKLRLLGKPVPMLGPAAGVKHLTWSAPVRAGDDITFATWAERKLEISTHDDWGLLVAGAEGVNGSGEKVVSFYTQMLLQRASPARGTA